MMRFDLVRPCSKCPFRKDVHPYLSVERVIEILFALQRQTFACHETVYREQPRDARGRFGPNHPRQHCAGALILMEREGWWGDLIQVATRLGILDPKRLDMRSPVYASINEMVEAYIEKGG